ILLARQRSRGEARADLDALHRIDAHETAGDVLVELAVDRRAEPSRHAFGHDLDDGADGGAFFPHLVEEIGPLLHRLGVGAEERVALDLGPIPGAAVNGVRPDLHKRAAHAHAGYHFAGDGARRHTACGLPRARTARAAPVAHAVFDEISVVGVAWAELVLDIPVVLGARVDILDLERN